MKKYVWLIPNKNKSILDNIYYLHKDGKETSTVSQTEKIQLEKHVIYIKVTDLMERNFIESGIDYDTVIKSALNNEMNYHIEKKIFNEIEILGKINNQNTWSKLDHFLYKHFKYKPVYRFKNTRDFFVLLMKMEYDTFNKKNYSDKSFVIIPRQYMTDIYENEYFIRERETIDDSYNTHKIGRINNIDILISSHRDYKDNNVIFGMKSSINGGVYVILEEPVTTIESDNTFKTYMLDFYSHVGHTNNSYDMFNTFIMKRTKFNFFRHLYQNIKKKFKKQD
jgi:hypothetical protein